jgi:hypothetical protein
MSQGYDQVCQACATAEARESEKEGRARAYWIGAGIVLTTVILLLLRIVARLH